ncbi:MAG: carbon-nitrogen hydrolase family protein [Eubacteriales bacterium]|nr:carbon-nitrogen hydrolase family protein [Eubacteriales bacterium]
MKDEMKIMAVQMPVTEGKEKNIETMLYYLGKCEKEHPDLVALPEMFDCPYRNSLFRSYAEKDGGPVFQLLSDTAKKYGIYFVAGSVPELGDDDRVYNTSYAFGPDGSFLAKHRKMHLFDISIPGKQTFQESKTLSPGNQVTVFDTEFGPIGLAVCYDIRFPELFRLMALKGARLAIVPAAFNLTTGEPHWEMLLRMRALDNQMYVLGVEPERDENGRYVAWGHTMLTNPWGVVVKELGIRQGYFTETIDLSYADRIKEELPLLRHRRTDVYEVIEKQPK